MALSPTTRSPIPRLSRLQRSFGGTVCAPRPDDHGQAGFVLLGRPISFYWEPFRRLSLGEETLALRKSPGPRLSR